ncbi:sulfate ABC transporter permease subunit CysW [Thermoleophilia bacterium SCSIO 60948]|nr:sulfate ABC transporter permease subunit CysW [Thermoleophilia bacterium SCSIO 60948]
MTTPDSAVDRNVVAAGRGTRLGLRFVGLAYLALLLLIPVALVFYYAFEDGIASAFASVTTPEAQHAIWLTCVMVLIAVPINTVFGITCALVLVRQKFRGKAFINALIDMPFAISPVVIGLSLVLVYGSVDGWFGVWLAEQGIQVIFSPVGMALATMFVSLPFVVREVVPVLQEIGDEQEQAAKTLGANPWQTFWKITLPSIRWGVTYGVILATARALGEFGAVAVVSGRISGETETLPLYVRKLIDTFDDSGAFMAALILAALALMTLLAMNLVQRRDRNVGIAPSVVAEPAAIGASAGATQERTPGS